MHSGYLSAWSHLRAIASILAAACIQKERALICEETTSALPKESNGRGMCANGLAQITTSILRRSRTIRSEEHTSELQSLMRISYAVFCLKKKKQKQYYQQQELTIDTINITAKTSKHVIDNT